MTFAMNTLVHAINLDDLIERHEENIARLKRTIASTSTFQDTYLINAQASLRLYQIEIEQFYEARSIRDNLDR